MLTIKVKDTIIIFDKTVAAFYNVRSRFKDLRTGLINCLSIDPASLQNFYFC